MVQSSAATVDAWFEAVDPKRKPALEAVRAAALKAFGPAAERMSYGMPAYVRPDDAPVFAFNTRNSTSRSTSARACTRCTPRR